MAVYRRTYAAYTGAMTPSWSRFLVLFRYARRNVFRSKFQTGFFVLCFFFPVFCLALIYLAHNLAFLEQIGAPSQILTIDNKFFSNFISVQGVLAFLMTAFAGPGLISSDLANGALALIFLPPVVARGIRPRKIFGPRHSAFANHLDPGTDSVYHSSQPSPGRLGPGITCGLPAASSFRR